MPVTVEAVLFGVAVINDLSLLKVNSKVYYTHIGNAVYVSYGFSVGAFQNLKCCKYLLNIIFWQP